MEEQRKESKEGKLVKPIKKVYTIKSDKKKKSPDGEDPYGYFDVEEKDEGEFAFPEEGDHSGGGEFIKDDGKTIEAKIDHDLLK